MDSGAREHAEPVAFREGIRNYYMEQPSLHALTLFPTFDLWDQRYSCRAAGKSDFNQTALKPSDLI